MESSFDTIPFMTEGQFLISVSSLGTEMKAVVNFWGRVLIVRHLTKAVSL
jgi:hypothetical protein